MKNTREPDATKLQNKQNTAQQSPDMTTNLLFREVGKKLAILDPAKSISKTLAFDRLWKELRAGALQAGFYIGARWIDIPTSFWQSLEVDRLKQLLAHKGGKFRLSLIELSDYVVNASSANGAFTAEELKQLLQHSQKGFEPEITGAVWRAFLTRNDLSDRPAHAKKKTGGNTQKESWREVAAFTIGYFVANRTRPTGKTGIQEDMRVVRERLRTPTDDWPGNSSIRDIITAGLKMAKEIEKIK